MAADYLAGPANPAPAVWPICVHSVEQVTVDAVRCDSIFCARRNAAKDIYTIGYGFQVSRVYASRYSAKMVNYKAAWDWPMVRFINQAVRLPVSPSIFTDFHI